MFLGAAMRKYILLLIVIICSNSQIAEAQDNTPTLDIATLQQQIDGGSTKAAIILAKSYEDLKEYKKAEHWYRYALYKGTGKAALNLYRMHEKGMITLKKPESFKQIGISMIMEESEQGSASSALILAVLYLQGKYIKSDYALSYKWFLVAEEGGKPTASYHLGVSYINGLYHNISARKALMHFKRASDGGIAEATRQVAIAYHSGIGTNKSLNTAIQFYDKSVQQGSILAMRDLANIYRDDIKDNAKYKYWLEKAANGGDFDAHYYLGLMYKNNNPQKSNKHFWIAAKMKHHLARMQVDKKY